MPIPASISDAERARLRNLSGDRTAVAVTTEGDGEGLLFEQASPTVIYLAEGIYGALTSEAKWKIKKIDLSSGVRILSSSQDFDQIWDDRAALTYV